MLKKPPSRNQRTKGIRVKHILQIVLLLGVCIWLIYQLKHSFDKKAALAENDSKTSIRTQTESEHLKLGRKDLPHEDVTTHLKREEEEDEEALREEEEKHEVEDEKHEAEEREEEDPKHEVEDIDEEGQKHEGEEQEEEEKKTEELEDDGQQAGDEEIDENDLDSRDGGDDRTDLVDEEKEREDGGDEKDVDRSEEEGIADREDNDKTSDDQDNDGDKNAHEAREEHYKGDDASSAVTHDTQVISTETEKVSSESSNETSQTGEAEDGNQHNMRLVDAGTSENGNSSVPASEEKLERNSSNTVVNSLLDTSVKTQSSDLPEAENNSTIVSSEGRKNIAEVDQATSAHQPNETGTISESTQSQNVAADGMAAREGSTEQTVVVEQTNNTVIVNDQSNSSASVSSHEVETNVSEKTLISDGIAKEEDGSRSSTIKQTTDATEYEQSTNEDASKNEESANEDAGKNEESANENAGKNEELANEDATKESNDQDATKTEESDDTSESSRVDEGSDSTNRTEDVVQDDPIDSSDSHISEDEKEARTDLDTLPDIQTEGDENGEAAVE